MKTTTLLPVFLLFSFFQIQAQNVLTGWVADASGNSLPAVSILLLNAADSSLVRGQIAGPDGVFRIEKITPGQYLVRASLMGYLDHLTAAFSLSASAGEQNLGILTLDENANTLNEVEIVAEKPLYEQQIDRLVVNVSNSVTSAGATALEVLERSPGVTLDRQNNTLSLAGKDGVVVMINGKRNYMPMNAVVQMLAGMSANNIEKIELIATPPAGFDAEGNAGIINLVLKKNPSNGLNGSFSATAGYGRGLLGSASANFNLRQEKFSLFGDYSYQIDQREQVFSFFRTLDYEGDVKETITESQRDPDQQTHNARLGFDYYFSENTIGGVMLSGYNSKWDMIAENTEDIYSQIQPDTFIDITNHEINHWQHAGANVNLQHTFAGKQRLNFDADYLYYLDDNPNDYDNRYYGENGEFMFSEMIQSSKLTPINIAVGKVDFYTPVNKKINLETGIKATASRFRNDVSVEEFVSGTWVEDPRLTANYKLVENIAAAYATLDIAATSKTNIKAGLRYEYTNSNLGSDEQADIVDRQYGNFFPTVFVSHNFNDDHSFQASYSRRITRPTFQDMAPFVIFMGPHLFFSGNAAIQPAIANSVAASYRMKSVIFRMEYTHEDSTITGFQGKVDPETNLQVLAAVNMSYTKNLNATLMLPVHPTMWWDMQYNITGNWEFLKGYFDGFLYENDIPSARLFSTQTFKFPKEVVCELSGFYNTPSLFGTGRVNAMWMVNVALQKKIGESTFRFGIDDLFNSQVFHVENNLPELYLVGGANLDFSQRTFKLTYSRNFGSNKVKSARQRETGADTDGKRVKG